VSVKSITTDAEQSVAVSVEVAVVLEEQESKL